MSAPFSFLFLSCLIVFHASSPVTMIGIPEEPMQLEKLSKSPVILKDRKETRRRTSLTKCLISEHLADACRERLVIVEGNIGVGKSTLARKMAKELGCTLFMEPTVENPYLEKFYADPHKYALKLQLWILQQRYLTYVEAVNHLVRTGE